MWLASRLSRGSAADCLNDECYINDEVGYLTFENICGTRNFETAWSWTDMEQDHIALVTTSVPSSCSSQSSTSGQVGF